jgi:hypothetical protein
LAAVDPDPAGRIPHVRLGRHRRLRGSAIEAWVGELEVASTGAEAGARTRPARLDKVGNAGLRRARFAITSSTKSLPTGPAFVPRRAASNG